MPDLDQIVRYGGDEFVCGLGGADLDDAERRFDLIGRSMRTDTRTVRVSRWSGRPTRVAAICQFA